MTSSPPEHEQGRGEDFTIRPLDAADLASLEQLFLANQPTFSSADVEIGLEVARDALCPHADEPNPYLTLILERAGTIVGFAAYGQVPLTQGTYDLYWIVVHPRVQGAGLGTRLLSAVEEDIARRGGRQIMIETSSRDDYERARRLYLRVGCIEVARIPDFYRVGEDRVLFLKPLRH